MRTPEETATELVERFGLYPIVDQVEAAVSAKMRDLSEADLYELAEAAFRELVSDRAAELEAVEDVHV